MGKTMKPSYEYMEHVRENAMDHLSEQIEKAYKCGCRDGKRQAQDLIEQAYQRGYKAGQEIVLTGVSDKCIEKGRNEAWAAAQTILKLCCSIDNEVLNAIFGTTSVLEIVHTCPPSEAISKIKAYEEKKKQESDKIKIGDEVAFPGGTKLIVIGLSGDGKTFDGLYAGGEGVDKALDKNQVTKTGRHFSELTELLKKLKEDK